MANRITVIENIFSANDQIAEKNRELLTQSRLFSINLMASPGAGKTSLIEQTVKSLSGQYRLAVIDGDIATNLDAERAAAAGALAVQINTGGECHLDALMVQNALNSLPLPSLDFLIVENVGNLVCPASFKLGVHKNVLIASIPEGDDKPYKYPGMFQSVDVMVINKIDLLPYIPFRMDYFLKGVEILNPGIQVFQLSCTSREGLESWLNWIVEQIASFREEVSR